MRVRGSVSARGAWRERATVADVVVTTTTTTTTVLTTSSVRVLVVVVHPVDGDRRRRSCDRDSDAG